MGNVSYCFSKKIGVKRLFEIFYLYFLKIFLIFYIIFGYFVVKFGHIFLNFLDIKFFAFLSYRFVHLKNHGAFISLV